MKKKDLLLLLLCVFVTEFAGFIGSIYNITSLTTWYRVLQKSPLNPPDWVFAPVWIILFLLMGVSLFMVIRAGHRKFFGPSRLFHPALIAFFIQLILNIFWTFIFFYLRSPFSAFIEILFLIAAIIVTMYYFYRLKPAAAYLLIPYLVWVIFAGYLNLSFYLLNS